MLYSACRTSLTAVIVGGPTCHGAHVQAYLLLTSQSDAHPVSPEDFHLPDLVLQDHSCLWLSILQASLKGLLRILLKAILRTLVRIFLGILHRELPWNNSPSRGALRGMFKACIDSAHSPHWTVRKLDTATDCVSRNDEAVSVIIAETLCGKNYVWSFF